MALQTEIKMWLAVPLTEKQKAELGERMSSVELKIDKKETQKDKITKDFNKEIKELQAELHAIAKQFEDNSEQKEIDCKVEFNTPEKGKKTVIRLDLNTVAHVFDMSEQEVKALEEPGLFDKEKESEVEISDEDFYQNMYGFSLQNILPVGFTDEELEAAVFIVDSFESLTSRGIENVDEEAFKQLQNCVGILGDSDFLSFIKDVEPQLGEPCFIAESEEFNSWHFFPPVIPQAVNVQTVEDSHNDHEEETVDQEEEYADYQLPEKEE